MREYIVDDSSVHRGMSGMIAEDYSIRVGMVREHVYLNKTGQTRYIVEVWKNNRLYPMTCIRTTRFGGLYNYEEYTHKGFTPGNDNASLGNFNLVPGDMVIVAAADGESREGIILGSLNHYGRDEVLPSTGDQAYVSEFNGLQTMINKRGEYRVTFKGAPTNLDKLSKAPNGEQYPLPEYNTDVGFSYYQFDKNGSYLVTDNSKENPQYIKVDKPNGKISIVSGKTELVIDKKEESYSITNKSTNFKSADSFDVSTKSTTIDSSDVVNVTSKAINTEGELTQTGDVAIEGNSAQNGNAEVNGNFTSTGTTSLGGGANPLVYDVLLIQGTGNLGAPVISQAILLKTVNTTAS